MLKQSPSRNQRLLLSSSSSSKSLKLKQAVQILVLTAIGIWLLYQMKKSYDRKQVVAMEEKAVVGLVAAMSEKGESEHQILRIGRKDLKPQLVEEVGDKLQGHGDEEAELEEDEDENEENKEELGTEDMDKDRSEDAEHDQFQDFIDEDDKER